MEHSPSRRQPDPSGADGEGREPRAGAGATLLLACIDLAGYLAVPASLLALGRGRSDAAIATAASATVLAIARAFLIGHAVETALGTTWRTIVQAAQAQSVIDLRRRREDTMNVAVLFEAAQQVAMHRAVAVPEIFARVAALIGVAVVTAATLGSAWLLLGALVVAPPVLISVAATRRLRRSQDLAWSTFAALGRDVRVLLEASLELRAHDREQRHAAALLGRVRAMASAERIVHRYSAMIALLPMSLTLLAVATPVRAGVEWVTTALVGPRMAEVGILGATAAVLGLGLARSIDASRRAAPARVTLAEFAARATKSARNQAAMRTGIDPGSLESVEIVFDGVSCVYAGSGHATPFRFTHRWAGPGGLAVTGDNGTGKTTLALALLGIVEPTEGAIHIGGTPLREIDLARYRARIAYVPQEPFIDDGATVGWHLRLLLGEQVDEAKVEAALAEVGLLATLERRSAASGIAPCDVLAGELSGGERRRMVLARALLQNAALLIVDEPEAGLDREARARFVGILGDLARSRRVMLIAHDTSVIPGSFERAECAMGPVATT